ncbi:MAG TPA: hypothetical protein VHX37_08395 [Acidobacteriaceae bacterium]|nr:hypothetical protein [Acidobacteriaceae bacterium]
MAAPFEAQVSSDNEQSMAVTALMADAERTLALTHFEDVRGNREIVRQTVAHARRNYDDLLRRGGRMAMSGEEREAFQSVVDRLRASLRFFGEMV